MTSTLASAVTTPHHVPSWVTHFDKAFTGPLVGPLQKAPGGYTHLLVAIDKFSKWIEAQPIGKIRSEKAVLFFTNIVFRSGSRT